MIQRRLINPTVALNARVASMAADAPSSHRQIHLDPRLPNVACSFQVGDHCPPPLPVAPNNPIQVSRSETLPSPYPSGSKRSLSAWTSTLHGKQPPRIHIQLSSRHTTPRDSPTSGTASRLPTPNATPTGCRLEHPRLTGRPPRFRTIPQLPNVVVDIEAAPPHVTYWSKAPIWDWLIHGFRAHTVMLADDVVCVFCSCDDTGCFNIGAWVNFLSWDRINS